MSHSGLQDIQQDLPRTIRDAIELVNKIGEQYLWVDSLALVADDQEDLTNGIQNMDLIYEQSILTIVAATGLDASAGLPGVSENSRQVNQYVEEVLPGVKLTCQTQPAAYMKVSRYSTRGWTYQEQYLARRSLIFINQQVYFKCKQCVWAEDDSKDDSPFCSTYDSFDLMFLAIDVDESPLSAYQIVLEYYTARDLTIDNDAINAVSGFLKRLSGRMECRLVEGLATAAFDANMLFVPINIRDCTKSKRRSAFPSYSWAGWRGQQGWEQGDYVFEFEQASSVKGSLNLICLEEWLNTHTWIIWYERDPDGQVTPISVPRVATTIPSSYKDIDYHHRALADFPSLSHKSPLRTNPTRQISLRKRSTYPLLQFWTAVGYFSIRGQRIFDRENQHCGAIIFHDIGEFKDGQIAEFLLLSKAQQRSRQSLIDKDLPNPARLANRESSDFPWDLYWVMLVVWKDDVAEKRGLGQVHQSALSRSYAPGLQWKEILLG
ncbi:hypothetical protein MMC17_000983 [Xylographa soralifera]|nr:hypothetical protein [Xylographa soralifera]